MDDLLTSFKDNCGFGLLASIDNRPDHKNLEDAISSLERMMHRGGVGADGKSGDGAGLLLSMPERFMHKIARQNGCELTKQYAVAMIFYNDDAHLKVFREYCKNNDLEVLFTREVPIDTEALGEQAHSLLPKIVQVFVAPSSIMATRRFEALLYLARKEAEHAIDNEDFYICSFSNKVISYKGLVMPTIIKSFYLDLQDEDFEISFCLFHQRFSTNTLPQWRLAQPFRMIAHNGEINSIHANRVNVKARSENLHSDVYSDEELERLMPILLPKASDSASFDNFFEFLIINGMDFFKAARAVIPAPWQNSPRMDPKLRAFYEYMSVSFEAWDGPAAISLTDGRYIGCVLDRNGLRPSKYIITKDRRLLISSEYGVLDTPEDNIVERGRLQSGEMMGLDLKYGQVLKSGDIDTYLKDSKPYDIWLNKEIKYLQEHVEIPFKDSSALELEGLKTKQRYFNYTHEVIQDVVIPMMEGGKEATGSMGDDTPIAAFSQKQRNFSDFFKQKFAQVTNPPIDPIREKIVMSLNTGFGSKGNILEETETKARRLKTVSPILSYEKLRVLQSYGDPKSPRYDRIFHNKTFDITYTGSLKQAVEALAQQVYESVKNEGTKIIILDDSGVSAGKKTIPMLMAVGRVHQYLLDMRYRSRASIVAVTGQMQDSHMAASLLSFGATAIYPYMLFATAYEQCQNEGLNEFKTRKRLKSVMQAINAGILKIMSKMGIATAASYKNSALFDAIGLSREVVNECFEGAAPLLAGLGYEDIDARIEHFHKNAFENSRRIFPLEIGGFYKHIGGGEFHDFGPEVVHAIHKLAQSGEREDYERFKALVNGRDKKMIRDFFTLKPGKKAIGIEKVEPKEEIFKRFATAAMSLGSISPEAHECLAEAMNKIGGMSNCGEGGEDAARFESAKNSKIKQIASGRFGVTPSYLASAEEIQIKVAQGAKPGEGGQLPGHKVNALVAKLRYTSEGVTLISPPPHHDIYSIEDLAQLIFDLKQVNPEAIITVKLVSTAGVGTIAAGVAKAYADKIIISGGDGGTGAAPQTSIKFAGNPWELGLSEAHQALKVNGLRGSVHLQTDGGLKTGLDVVKAAILGAESYAFGTAALTILGCKILRICHLNKCTVGVATQEESLREHYVGSVERVINYFSAVAEDIREILASLGYKSLDEIIGQTHLLEVIDDKMAKKFDFDAVIRRVEGVDTAQVASNDPYDKNEFEQELLKEVFPTIQDPSDPVVVHKNICNLNRSFGARISGQIAKYYGDEGLPDDRIIFKLKGIAGQSLGAFLAGGVSIYIDGAGNDYVGKGMNGGKIVITNQNGGSGFSLAGNTCLYGATGGKLYVAGNVGERFGVRNSGCLTVVEGTGDHPCEYMTGGVAVILGKVGVNFGAGMTGGVAFVYDEGHHFIETINQELIEGIRIDTDERDYERHYLKKLLKDYINETGSPKAKMILDNFRVNVRNFWMIKPKDVKSPLDEKQGE